MDIEEEMQQMYADLFEAAAVSRQQGEELAGSVGQTQARYQVIWTIESDRLTVPQVARRLGVSRQNVQRIVDRLQAEGLVRLADNPDHKTSPLLELTDAGHKRLTQINSAANDAHRLMLAHFSEGDVRSLRALLRKLVTTIDETSGVGVVTPRK